MSEDEESVRFHDAYASAQRLYQDISGWTGLSVEQILTGELPEEHALHNSMLAIRSIGGQLAVHDVLAEAGVRPRLVVALSLGISSASAMIGALSREDLFRMLWHRRHLPGPGPDAPAEGVAFCHLDPDSDPARFYGPQREGVHVGVDFGIPPDGKGRNVILSGYRAALERLAEEEPEHVMVMPRGTAAVHSPLRQPASDFIKEYVRRLSFRDPVLPLAACLDDRLLTTADEVRDAVWRNLVQTASIPTGMRQAVRAGVQLLILPGPSMADGMINFPVPVLAVREPEDVEKAVATVEALDREPTTI